MDFDKTYQLLIRCSAFVRYLRKNEACSRVLRRIFGPKRVELKWYRWKMVIEELDDLCSSPDIIHVMK
jgi:hypothetical protein